jgi:hypothetical protein
MLFMGDQAVMKSSLEVDGPPATGRRSGSGEPVPIGRGRGNDRAGVPPERPPFPVTPRLPLVVDPAERRRIRALARQWLDREPDLPAVDLWGPGLRAGLAPGGPCLHVHDVLGATVTPGHRDLALEARAYALAGDDDLVLSTSPPGEAFAEYRRALLGLGSAETLVPAVPPLHLSLAQRCLQDPACIGRVVERAREAGALTVVPYVGGDSEWALAGEVARRSGAEVRVAAAPPRLTLRTNDKLWFVQVVEALLGARAEPPSFRAQSLVQLAGRVRKLCRRFPRIGIKLPRSAGALGNVVLDVRPLSGHSLSQIRSHLAGVLEERGWRERFPVLVSVWEQPVLLSPSVQVWVPERGVGPPIIEGVFDQEILGLSGEFGGCHPTALPSSVCNRLAHESGLLAVFFQELGYFGRCSFDAILVGEQPETSAVHWIECNGRWGGTSVPMTLADRLVGDWRRVPFAAIHRDDPDLTPRPFEAVLRELDRRLFGRSPSGEGSTGIVLLCPGGFEDGRSIDVMALASTPEEALEEAEEVVGYLLGPGGAER